MKKIIGFYGAASKGKTETLNLLIDLLNGVAKISGTPVKHWNGKDKQITFIYKGNIVSICTAGDNEDELRSNIKYFEKEKCDIAISATRTKGATVDILHDFGEIKNKVRINWIKKIYNLPNKDTVNKQQAESIFKML